MKPANVQLIGDLLVVVWDDRHESYFPLETLRRACPCAVCAGEPDLLGRVSRGAEPTWSPRSFELTGVDAIGNYGLQLNWADGHTWGIWTHERLRTICPCDECVSAATKT